MKYVGTRGGENVPFARAVISGMAGGGGLYVPESFPRISAEELEAMLAESYPERAARIISKLSGFDGREVLSVCENAYKNFGGDPVPLVKLDDGVFMLELFWGPTASYKDFSFAVFPYILGKAAEECGVKEKALVISATAGDAGVAAINAFRDDPEVKVFAFYPNEGVSKMQKLNLSVQEGENIFVSAVRADFGECVAYGKKLIRGEKLINALKDAGYFPVSANSLNVGVLIPRVACFFSAYLDLVSGGQSEMGEEVDFTLPAGNFGNALACYWAKLMGLPVRRIHCACSVNSVLPDFFATGCCDINREFVKSTAPQLDVVLPSNLERLLFEIFKRDTEKVKAFVSAAEKDKRATISQDELLEITKIFDGGYASEETSVEAMYSVFTDVGYTMDTGTGYAMKVALDWFEKNKKDETKMVILSTANPYKCPQDVLYAVTGNDVKDCFKGVKRLHAATAMAVPNCISQLKNKTPRFTKSCDLKRLDEEILSFLTPATPDNRI